MSLENFPVEIIDLVLQFMTLKSRANLCACSKYFYDIIVHHNAFFVDCRIYFDKMPDLDINGLFQIFMMNITKAKYFFNLYHDKIDLRIVFMYAMQKRLWKICKWLLFQNEFPNDLNFAKRIGQEVCTKKTMLFESLCERFPELNDDKDFMNKIMPMAYESNTELVVYLCAKFPQLEYEHSLT